MATWADKAVIPVRKNPKKDKFNFSICEAELIVRGKSCKFTRHVEIKKYKSRLATKFYL